MSESISVKFLELEGYSQLFKALGEVTRLKMIGLLEDRELCVCDFMAMLDLGQSTASRHLAYLKNSGWVIGRREGKWMYYRLHPNAISDPTQHAMIEQISSLAEIRALCETLQTYLKRKNDACNCS